jgi:hypothetical protein
MHSIALTSRSTQQTTRLTALSLLCSWVIVNMSIKQHRKPIKHLELFTQTAAASNHCLL